MKKRVHKKLPRGIPRFQWRHVYITEAVEWNGRLNHLATHAYENDARAYTLNKWVHEMEKHKNTLAPWSMLRVRKEKVYMTERTRMDDAYYSVDIIVMYEFPAPDGETKEFLTTTDFKY